MTATDFWNIVGAVWRLFENDGTWGTELSCISLVVWYWLAARAAHLIVWSRFLWSASTPDAFDDDEDEPNSVFAFIHKFSRHSDAHHRNSNLNDETNAFNLKAEYSERYHIGPFTFRLMSNKCLITHISFESAAALRLFSFSRLCSGWQFNPTASVSFKPFSECQSLCFKKTLTSSNETCQDDFDLDKILFVLNSYESNCHVQWSPTSCYLISVSRWYLFLIWVIDKQITCFQRPLLIRILWQCLSLVELHSIDFLIAKSIVDSSSDLLLSLSHLLWLVLYINHPTTNHLNMHSRNIFLI